MSGLMQLKAQNESRLAEEKRLIERKRNVLILMQHYCAENGYLQTAERLQQEAGVAISKFEVVDNLDLLRIVQEYEEYEEVKFGKKPKLVRRLSPEDHERAKSVGDKKAVARENRRKRNEYSSPNMPSEARVESNVAIKAISSSSTNASGSTRHIPSKTTAPSKQTPPEEQEADGPDLGLVGYKPTNTSSTKKQAKEDNKSESVEERLLKPLPTAFLDTELKPLAETITREIFQQNPNVRWEDVVGLDETKRLLKEAVVMPLRYPELFSGLLSPWCGILLYGPPGNGKTMLAKAVATECQTTFFNISASSIVSKYRGDSEKLIRLLFELARYHAPSTIFLDEIDSIMGQRESGGGGQEHEASRRMKTELLIQMDGLTKTDDVVFVLAASNIPWELDAAMLRRLEKRVLVDLPSPDARRVLLHTLLEPYVSTDFDVEVAVTSTEGYSGADLKLVAKETCMMPVRRLMHQIETLESGSNNGNNQVGDAVHNWQDLLEKVQPNDLAQALDKTKPSTSLWQRKYKQWQSKFGST